MGMVMVMEERKRNTKKIIAIMMTGVIINGTGIIKTEMTEETMMIIKRFQISECLSLKIYSIGRLSG